MVDNERSIRGEYKIRPYGDARGIAPSSAAL